MSVDVSVDMCSENLTSKARIVRALGREFAGVGQPERLEGCDEQLWFLKSVRQNEA